MKDKEIVNLQLEILNIIDRQLRVLESLLTPQYQISAELSKDMMKGLREISKEQHEK